MLKTFLSSLLALLIALMTGQPFYQPPEDYEEEQARMATTNEYHGYIDDLALLPVSFRYGKTLHKGLAGFTETGRKTVADENKTNTVITLMHPDNKLKVTVEAALYTAYNAYEWTLYFTNAGDANTAVLSQVRSADITLAGSNPVLSGIAGDGNGWYEPYEYDVTLCPRRFVSNTGRATDKNFPYFNLETDSGGAMIAIGWPGTWKASFTYDHKGTTRVIASGTNSLCTYLKPGETVRTPLMAFLRYFERDRDMASNLWRQWYIDCIMPSETAGSTEPLQPQTCYHLSTDSPNPSSDGSVGFEHSSWRASYEKVLAENLHFDYQWYDAGWYLDEYGQSIWDKWYRTGTLTLDPDKWPEGTFLEMTQTQTQHGTKTLLWFEPERIGVENFGEFCENYGYKSEWRIGENISNLGNPECLEWTYNKIIRVFEQTGIDLYREDFNTEPADDWRSADLKEGPFRCGITENKYVCGHLELWDRIIAYCAATGRSTVIDSCASGGRRNDLETMKRAVPFLRSDADRYTAETRLSVTTTYMQWIPCNGTNMLAPFSKSSKADSVYLSRVSFLPINAYGGAWSRNPDLDFDALRQALSEWEQIKRYYYNDFYALTPYHSHTDDSGWTAWMYFDAADDSGVLQVFRQSGNVDNTYRVCLRGVDDAVVYNLNDIDGANSLAAVTGAQLKAGIDICLAEPSSAALLFIEKADA
ncbi:MAG TPA: alpha-galactosidase [Clostridiales bacterium]|nr:MAG: Melibiase [Firmicutes bacterium ADurb.Bin262]HQK73893.1 alpha-galactosidase [Clostridiales bacterium]